MQTSPMTSSIPALMNNGGIPCVTIVHCSEAEILKCQLSDAGCQCCKTIHASRHGSTGAHTYVTEEIQRQSRTCDKSMIDIS